MSSNDQAQENAAKQEQVFWILPQNIQPIQVIPDRYTKSNEVSSENMKGKESDPSRMGVFVCLLDNKPHLHPSLQALHKHRLIIHKIPLPADPINDLPVSQSNISNITNPFIGQIEQDIIMSSTSDLPQESVASIPNKTEWFMWKFSEEEANRRKSYLPLA
ncbi:40S ribosomal eS28 domain-containing protein [Kwoniella pini CBS 10737]